MKVQQNEVWRFVKEIVMWEEREDLVDGVSGQGCVGKLCWTGASSNLCAPLVKLFALGEQQTWAGDDSRWRGKKGTHESRTGTGTDPTIWIEGSVRMHGTRGRN
mmetsp:Transcript_36212/g.77207  ORF Transcript_36212/g.77207 Transcript_36212/m.77207 type:complete len:104 (+) Transcript_36212:431-742(+)